MSTLKKYLDKDVYTSAKERISYIFDHFDKIYMSFSAGKDSSVQFHLMMEECIKRDRKVGVMLIDLEAQYNWTITHAEEMFEEYEQYIDVYWICLPMALRNAVSNFEPRWTCWDADVKESWVREMPTHKGVISDVDYFPFFQKGMEFEEFMVLFGKWYGDGEEACGFVGIRADESLNRFRTIASKTKETFHGKQYTTKVCDDLYNAYPIYDWKTQDVWHYHAVNPQYKYNEVYNQMHKAGLTPHQMRLCQPYGDDQRRGLFLYHILEPATWYKLIARVNGVNSGALYIQESGNITGYNNISKPDNHTWKSFATLLLNTLPEKTRDHYIPKFKTFLKWWKEKGYPEGIPDEAPKLLENQKVAPSWRRICKVLLRNDYWCKGLGFTQPTSPAFKKYMKLKKEKKLAMKGNKNAKS
jgi:predicted phosphoadenosine phosphosulfate sulfurtransferase